MAKTRRNPKRKGKVKNFKMKAAHKSYYLFDKVGREKKIAQLQDEANVKNEMMNNSIEKRVDTVGGVKGFINSMFGKKGDR